MKSSIVTDPQKIEELLTRGVHEVFGEKELREKLLSGKQLHLKLGTDVTGKDLHLGHFVIHRKIRDFQELGHKVTLIIGDFTTIVGDHSDKVDMRSETNEKEIAKNEKTYKEQFFKTVLKKNTKVVHNSKWLKPLDFSKFISMMRAYTIQQMFDRETFKKRFQEGKPIGFDEWAYPLMQGYDSVMLKPDVELGGTDQTFNLLAGRRLMPLFGLPTQSAVAMKLLLGSDGRPMGKSLENFIPINAVPSDMYGKIMAVVDAVVWEYFELITRVPLAEIEQMKQQVATGINPRDIKMRLAREVVAFFHGVQVAEDAERYFITAFQKKEIPDELEKVSIKNGEKLIDALVRAGVVESKGDFRRLVDGGAVTDLGTGEKITDQNFIPTTSQKLKIGKRRFVEIIIN